MTHRVDVLLNRHSGSAGLTDQQAERITALFAGHGVACDVNVLHHQANVPLLAREASARPDTVVIAAGGDGTVRAVASAVADTGRPMGVLPVGTLNHFAKDLGLPLDLAGAVRVASGHDFVEVDAAEVNGHLFINNSSLGFYPAMVLQRERLRRVGWNKWLSLMVASAQSFLRFRHIRVRFEVEGQAHACTTPFLFVGNNEYRLHGVQLGTREHLNRGRLFLYVAPGAQRMDILRMTFAALLDRPQKNLGYEVYCVTEFTVAAHKRKTRVALDGEIRRLKGPLTYRIRPLALRVLCDRPVEGKIP